MVADFPEPPASDCLSASFSFPSSRPTYPLRRSPLRPPTRTRNPALLRSQVAGKNNRGKALQHAANDAADSGLSGRGEVATADVGLHRLTTGRGWRN